MTYTISLTPLFRWQVVRSDGMLMAVLNSKGGAYGAEAYVARKEAQARQDAMRRPLSPSS